MIWLSLCKLYKVGRNPNELKTCVYRIKENATMTDAEFNKKCDNFWASCSELKWDKTAVKILNYDNSEIRDELIYEGMNRIIDFIILVYWNYSEEVLNELIDVISALTMLSKAQDGLYFK